MKLQYGATSALALGAALMATGASAIGIDRSNQDVTAIFEEGNVAELSFGRVLPDLSGKDRGLAGDYDNVGEEFNNFSASVKMDFGRGFSAALIADQPFGADILYEGDPGTTFFGGTSANLDSTALTLVGRYRINESFSLHAGVRRETLEGAITLSGRAYGPVFDGATPTLNGYAVDLDENSANGYVIGAAYEKPEIALRVALTYNSAIEHDFDTTESLAGNVVASGTTTVETPESWNLDMQTGIAANTLVFANIRYAAYEDTLVSPDFFAGATGGLSLTDIDDNYSAQIGLGRKFSDAFSGQIAVGVEPEGDERISPLDPTDGKGWVSLGGAYNMEAVTISGGIRYTKLGDASPQTRNPATGLREDRADFTDSSAVALGMSVAYRF